LCSLPQQGSKQNYGSLFLILFHGTEFQVSFSSAEGFGTEFRDFLFRGTTGIPSEKNHLFRLFRLPRNYFFVGNSQPFLFLTNCCDHQPIGLVERYSICLGKKIKYRFTSTLQTSVFFDMCHRSLHVWK
jgi:hypothetical protein